LFADCARHRPAARLTIRQRSHVLSCKFLPRGSLRQDTEQRLWDIGGAIADLYAARRPSPLAAQWAVDAEVS
jgi:hypothetical protein